MKNYAIKFAASAAKEFRALPPKIKHRMTPAIDDLGHNPYPLGVCKLKGVKITLFIEFELVIIALYMKLITNMM